MYTMYRRVYNSSVDKTVTDLRALKFPAEFDEKHRDFLDIYSFCKWKYVRNVLRYDKNFQNDRFFRTEFDYEYANQNETITRFLSIQSELRRFKRLFSRSPKSFHSNLHSYIEFVEDSLEDLVTDIVKPISDIFPEICTIIHRYIPPPKPSSKINWEIANKILYV
jgi:hypothetical protein